MVPLNKLLLKYMNSISGQDCGIHGGSVPVNWLKAMTKVRRFVSSCHSKGIDPLNSFSIDSRYSKEVT